MSLKTFVTAFLLGISMVGAAGARLWADDSEPDHRKTYWQKNQLNNQSRLSSGPFEGFDVEGDRRRTDKRAPDEYLQKIRKQVASSASAARAEQGLNFQGAELSPGLITARDGKGGTIVTLRLARLFDENAEGLRPGAVETLDQVVRLLSDARGKPIQLVLADELEEAPEARTLDAGRSEFVAAYLSFKLSDSAVKLQ